MIFQTIDPSTLSRKTDPVSSRIAAALTVRFSGKHCERIVNCLLGGDMGASKIADLTGLTNVQVCRRLAELSRKGVVIDTGHMVENHNGRLEREWRYVRSDA